MNQTILDQYVSLKTKGSLTPEEQKVVDAIVALAVAEEKAASTVSPAPKDLAEAKDALEDAQEAIPAK